VNTEDKQYRCANPHLFFLLDLLIAGLIALVGALGLAFLILRGPRG